MPKQIHPAIGVWLAFQLRRGEPIRAKPRTDEPPAKTSSSGGNSPRPHRMAEHVAVSQREQVGFAKALQANLGTIGNRGQVLPRLASIRGADDERAVLEALPLRRYGGDQHAIVLELPVHGRQQAPIAEADDGVVGQWGFVGIAIVAGSPCDLGDEYDWHVDPQAGTTVEARLKVASCSAPWGVALLVSGHFCFYSGPTTSYNSVEEIAPNTLLVVYDRQQLDDGGNLRRETVGTNITVTQR